MKNKFLILSFAFLLTLQNAIAKNIKVEAVTSFSTAKPTKTWSVKIVESFIMKNGFQIHANSIIEGRIENVMDPKRLKRNASFVFVPTHYHDSKTGQCYTIKNDYTGKYSSMSDISVKSIAKQGAILVGNQVLDGFLGPGVAVAEGLIKNEQGNRAKSVVVSVYESTPLSYANKGKELEIEQGQQFIMSFKQLESNEPNYSYKIEE